MTSQATNRKAGGSTSCCGHSQKLRTYTYKEIETIRVAPELFGAPTIGRGVPGLGVVVEGVTEVKQDFQATWNIRKRHKKGRFPALINIKNAENAVFYVKVLNKIYS
jgi:hypothetical protein